MVGCVVAVGGQLGWRGTMTTKRTPLMDFDPAFKLVDRHRLLNPDRPPICPVCGQQVTSWANHVYLSRWGYCGSWMCVPKEEGE